MQTRRDHVQAYQFAMARLASALVKGDPGRGDSPTRRSGLGTFFGIGIAVLLCAGFGVYGLLSPGGNTSWRQPRSIIVEKETGNRYLYLGGELRPARNYASALLIAGDGATVRTVSRNSLDGVRRGPAVGILNAPDTLPPADSLLSGAWTRCLRADAPDGQLLDFAPSGHTRPFPADRQALLSSTSGDLYLLWRGTKYPVRDDASRIALGLDTQQPQVAPHSWLSALPTGPALAPARIPGAGRPGGDVAGRSARVGQLFQTTAGDAQHYYVLRSDGLEAINATESALLAAHSGAATPRRVAPADVAGAPVSKEHALMTAVPDVLDAHAQPLGSKVLCLRQHSSGTTLRTQVVLEGGLAASGNRFVLIPPGRGVVAVDQDRLSQQGLNPERYLITEQGVLYPLDGDQAGQALGYGGVGGVALPETVLGLLPQGPRLNTTAAMATTQGG